MVQRSSQAQLGVEHKALRFLIGLQNGKIP